MATCECGKKVDVPNLRQLTQLPQQQGEPVARTSTWSPRHAVALAGTLVTLAILLGAFAMHRDATKQETNENAIREYYDTGLKESITESLDSATPKQLFQLHYGLNFLARQGLSDELPRELQNVRGLASQAQVRRNTLLAVAGVTVLISIVAYFLFPATKT